MRYVVLTILAVLFLAVPALGSPPDVVCQRCPPGVDCTEMFPAGGVPSCPPGAVCTQACYDICFGGRCYRVCPASNPVAWTCFGRLFRERQRLLFQMRFFRAQFWNGGGFQGNFDRNTLQILAR